ncbi:hypothetical protein [Alkalihalobacillus deserti]|uniref:hypothetical protein n=1 Tax=Alkalihalobacillus deserti TaxID=2879466 RepID=UPI001D14DF39|nr:hypothetical protein [Alkalihalobacillus deserti]
MTDTKLFIGIDTSLSISKNIEKRKQFNIKRVQYEDLSPTVTFACYEKQETLVRTYFFKDVLILFVEVTPYIQQFEEMFGYGETEMDVVVTDISHETLIPKFEKVIAEKKQGYTELPYLHVYGQKYWHDDAIIVGNKTALKELRDVIDNAIQYGEGRLSASASDGEGYELFISCLPGETENNKDWQQMTLPYQDKEMYVPNVDEVDPFSLLKLYRNLLRRE